MHTPHYTKIHNRFLLNGFFYDYQGLKEVAYSFIKEGDLFERYMGDFLMDWLDQSETIYLETSGTTTSTDIIGSRRTGPALLAPDLNPIEPAILNAISEESTS